MITRDKRISKYLDLVLLELSNLLNASALSAHTGIYVFAVTIKTCILLIFVSLFVTTGKETQEFAKSTRERLTKSFKEELDRNHDGYLDEVCVVKCALFFFCLRSNRFWRDALFGVSVAWHPKNGSGVAFWYDIIFVRSLIFVFICAPLERDETLDSSRGGWGPHSVWSSSSHEAGRRQ